MTTTTDNATIARAVYDAFGRGDIPAVLEHFDPELVWVESTAPNAGTFHGPQGVVDGVFVPIGNAWEVFLVEPERVVAQGELVVAVGTYRGTSRATGKSMAARFAHVWQMRDGRLVHFEQIADTESFNAALR
ncbi:nuclear transport factor 2 family protein [Actinomycetospora sp. CA-053990]|uniref:nuclear transport factor 2 family protein n=1 Tax=Actinomycetospora sp. CA-053990 TaxID=3239891 RepID=UPI003D8AA718